MGEVLGVWANLGFAWVGGEIEEDNKQIQDMTCAQGGVETYFYIAVADGDDSEAQGNARDKPPRAQPFAANVAGNLKDDVLHGVIVIVVTIVAMVNEKSG